MCVKVLLCLAVVLVIFITFNCRETFATRQEKAEVINNWFASNNEPSFTKYKKDMSDANIVEYEDALKLKQNGGLSVGNVLKNI